MSVRARVIAWIDERFPLTESIRDELTQYPTPRNLSYWWSFGFLAMVVLFIQISSGVFLAMHYKADANLAFDSIQHIMREVNYGWLIRYMHTTGGSAFFIVIYVHMARTLYYGSYRAPRELLWWSGQILLLLLMASAFMGYLLPWGQLSYWGAQVITNLFGATPFIGDQLVIWMRGGYSVGDPTLTRFFALHYFVPFVIAGFVVFHLIGLHYVRSSNPTGINLKDEHNIPLHPFFTAKDFFLLGIFLIVYCGIVFFWPDIFIEKENNEPANPFKTPPHIVPEWYFLPFYTILRSIPNLLGGAIAMTVSMLIFAAMPYLDRSRIPGGARYRPVYRAMFYIFVADVLVLGYLGAHPPSGVYLVAGQVCTFIYFALFLLLPFVSVREDRWLRQSGRLPPEVAALLEEAGP